MQPTNDPRYRQPAPQQPYRVLIIFALAAGLVVTVSIGLAFAFAGERRREAIIDPNANAQNEARRKACPDLPTWDACVARQQAEADLKVKKAQAVAAASASASAAAIAELPKLTPAEREARVRRCIAVSACTQADMDLIIAAGATQRERDHLALLGFATSAESIAKTTGQRRTSARSSA